MVKRKAKALKQFAIGIDLGGTNLRFGLIDRKGMVLARSEEALPKVKKPEVVVATMVKRIKQIKRQLPEKSHLAGIGVGAPGGIDAANGIVTQSPNLPLWKSVPLQKMLHASTKIPVLIDNDANCFALGEQRFGNGRGVENLLALTIGTGIGGGMIVNTKLWHGDSGMAGEFGHMVIKVDGLPCACGGRGCFEAYGSGSALARMAREEIEKGRKTILNGGAPLNGEAIQQAADGADELALELFGRLGSALGYGIANLVNMTGITQVILGGKVIRSWDYFFPNLQIIIDQQCFRAIAEKIKIIPALLGDDAGLLGAASLVLG